VVAVPDNPVLDVLKQSNLQNTVQQNMGNNSPFGQAMQSMQLTPQEQYLYWHHLNNLYGPGKYIQPDGRVSTLMQAVVGGPGGMFYNIPTIWGGQQLSPEEATMRAGQVGWNQWPSYATPEMADARYEALHRFLEQDTEAYLGSHPSPFLLNMLMGR
jgi:hypothetical protein